MWCELLAHASRRALSRAISVSGIVAIVLATAVSPALLARATGGNPQAAARALAAAAGKPVPIPELTTENSTTVANPTVKLNCVEPR